MPISTTGIFVADDFDIDINANNGLTSLRVRRKSGIVPGNISIRIESSGTINDVFTPTSATSAVTAPTVIFGSNLAQNGWSTTGNSATVDGTNFIGTIDGVPINFRVNNQKSGRIAATGETFFGYEAGKNNTNSANDRNNSAFGYRAFSNNSTTTARDNTAIGQASQQDSNGSGNTTVGTETINATNSGSDNTAIGKQALKTNTASLNTAIGSQSMFFNTSGTNNVSVGYKSLNKNIIGNNNTSIGKEALFSSLGSNNTAIGNLAGNLLTSGTNNIIIGSNTNVSTPTSNDQMNIGNQIFGTTMSTTALGKIGIGETAPGYKFQVKGDIASTDGIFARSLYNVGMSTTSVFADNIEPWTDNGVRLYDGNTNSHLHLESLGYGLIQSYNVTGAAKGLLETASTTSDLILQRDGANVGINNISPSEKLDVAGNVKLSGALMPNNFPGIAGQVLISSGAGVAPIWNSNPVKPYFTTSGLSGVYNITLNQYTIRVFGGITNVILPTPVGNLGKTFVLIGSNGSGSHSLSTVAGVIYDDFGPGGFVSTINQGERITVQSDGTDWIVIGR